MFTFRRLRDRLYELRFDDMHEMCMTFLRYQEFYESPRYVGRKFTLAEYMSWYVKDQNKNGVFSYPQDWGGFNLPVDIIGKVHALGIDDPNHYDSLMFALYRTISAQCDSAYLIGVGKGAELDEHEMTHAMFHIDDEYRVKVLSTLGAAYNNTLVRELQDILLTKGYAQVTALDEVNAYAVTGDHGFFKPYKRQHRYRTMVTQLKKHHAEHYPRFIQDISP